MEIEERFRGDHSLLEKQIAVIHHTMSELGGGERVGATLIEALNFIGVIPDVYAVSSAKLKDLEDFYGKKLRFNLFRVFIPSPLTRRFVLYQRLAPSMMSFALSKYDVVVNTTGVYFPLFFKKFVRRYLLYVYNPLFAFESEQFEAKYRRSLFWRIYYQPYLNLIQRSIKKLGDAEILAVSNFTKWRIQKYWHKPSKTVYPPVDIDTFSHVFQNQKRNGVISIGRFTKEKNHLIQLEIAQQCPDLTFRLCGSVRTPHCERWFKHVKAKAEEMDLHNVELYPNIPFKSLLELIGESKFFLHTTVDEDFGLGTCEAIAGGCIPCVHDSGGQREVVPYPNLRFTNLKEAVKILSSHHTEKIKQELLDHIWQFREERFQKEMLDAIFNVKDLFVEIPEEIASGGRK